MTTVSALSMIQNNVCDKNPEICDYCEKFERAVFCPVYGSRLPIVKNTAFVFLEDDFEKEQVDAMENAFRYIMKASSRRDGQDDGV